MTAVEELDFLAKLAVAFFIIRALQIALRGTAGGQALGALFGTAGAFA